MEQRLAQCALVGRVMVVSVATVPDHTRRRRPQALYIPLQEIAAVGVRPAAWGGAQRRVGPEQDQRCGTHLSKY